MKTNINNKHPHFYTWVVRQLMNASCKMGPIWFSQSFRLAFSSFSSSSPVKTVTLQVGLMSFQSEGVWKWHCTSWNRCIMSWFIWEKQDFENDNCLQFVFSALSKNLPMLDFNMSKYHIWNNFFTATCLALRFDVCFTHDAIVFAFCLLLLQ